MSDDMDYNDEEEKIEDDPEEEEDQWATNG